MHRGVDLGLCHGENRTIVAAFASNKGSLKLRLTYEHEISEQVGTNADGTPKFKAKNKKETAEAPAVEKLTKLNVYTWKLPDTTSNIKLYLSGRTEIYAISVDGSYGVAVDNVAMRGSSGTVFHAPIQNQP